MSDNNQSIQDTITNVLNNDYVFAVIAILAFAYGQRAAPKLPDWLIKLFSYDVVRVLYLSLLLIVRFESRPTVAIIMALLFVYILQYTYFVETQEAFDNILKFKRDMIEREHQKEHDKLIQIE